MKANPTVQDRQRRRAARMLDLALCQQANGTFNALVWAAAGRPARGINHEDVRAFQAARRIVHDNNGTIKPGDVRRLLDRWRKGGDE